jgi:hypothetical protein
LSGRKRRSSLNQRGENVSLVMGWPFYRVGDCASTGCLNSSFDDDVSLVKVGEVDYGCAVLRK